MITGEVERVFNSILDSFINVFNIENLTCVEIDKNQKNLRNFNITRHFKEHKIAQETIRLNEENQCLAIKVHNPNKKSTKKIESIIETNHKNLSTLILLHPSERNNLRAFYKSNLKNLFSINSLINIKLKNGITSMIFLSRERKKNIFVHEFQEDIFAEIKLLDESLKQFRLSDEIPLHQKDKKFIGEFIDVTHAAEFNFFKHKSLQEFESLKIFYKDAISYLLGDMSDEIFEHGGRKDKIDDDLVFKWQSIFKNYKNRFLIVNRKVSVPVSIRYPSKERPVDSTFIKNNIVVILKNKYDRVVVQNFLNSEIGEVVRRSHGSLKRRVRNNKQVAETASLGKKHVLNLPILILSPRKTKKFSPLEGLQKIETFIEKLKMKENQHNSNYMKKIEALLEVIETPTPEDKALKRLSEDESETLEFKSGFFMNDELKKNEELSIKIFQTICAFMNKNGGQIYCGIRDSGELLGLQDEIKHHFNSNVDSFKLTFYQKLEQYIGKSKTIYVSAEMLEINSKQIFEITVKPCFDETGSYFNNDESELITRMGNRNQKRKGKDIIKYLNNRKPKN